MIQFNLLPDVKLEYIKTQRIKRAVIGISFIASAVALSIFVFLVLSVDVFQKADINNLTNDINKSSAELKQKPNLSKMLTVQSQLNALTALHDGKPTASRLFDFMNQVTPKDAPISQLRVDFVAKTMSITGNATTLDVVNAFTDALKFTTYKVDKSGAAAKPAFAGVVLTSFDRNAKNANYTISLSFDDTIFNNANKVTLTVNNTASAQAASIILQR
jgi:hypothetical protein